ncbi:MAG: hypothetical protein JXD23_06470 [Spirochaetales bacterium]|nr:hypothetical protein [Spirochaetales bacterium]
MGAANAEDKAKVVHRLHGATVLFQVPELASGPYRLIVRRAFGGEIREGTLKAELSVN